MFVRPVSNVWDGAFLSLLGVALRHRSDHIGYRSARGMPRLESHAHKLLTEQKERRAQQTEGGPEIVPVRLFFQVEPGKGDEHRQGDHFLQDLQLPDVHDLIADPVCGDLNQILEQCDSPADEGSEPPGFVLEVLKMPVPGDGHEDVAGGQHDDGQ